MQTQTQTLVPVEMELFSERRSIPTVLEHAGVQRRNSCLAVAVLEGLKHCGAIPAWSRGLALALARAVDIIEGSFHSNDMLPVEVYNDQTSWSLSDLLQALGGVHVLLLTKLRSGGDLLRVTVQQLGKPRVTSQEEGGGEEETHRTAHVLHYALRPQRAYYVPASPADAALERTILARARCHFGLLQERDHFTLLLPSRAHALGGLPTSPGRLLLDYLSARVASTRDAAKVQEFERVKIELKLCCCTTEDDETAFRLFCEEQSRVQAQVLSDATLAMQLQNDG